MAQSGSNVRVHPSALIDDSVTLGDEVTVGPGCILYAGVTVGAGTRVGARVTIGEPEARSYADPAYVAPATQIGEGSLLRSGTVIYAGCRFGPGFQTGHYAVLREFTVCGARCSFGTFAQSDGHCTLGDHVRIHYAAHVCQTARLGNYVWLYPYSMLTNDLHPPCNQCVEGPIIEDYAVIAAHCVVLPRVRVGAHALVGAGSVVSADVPARAVVATTPARRVADVGRIRCDVSPPPVTTPYPWPTHFDRGYPWEGGIWHPEE